MKKKNMKIRYVLIFALVSILFLSCLDGSKRNDTNTISNKKDAISDVEMQTVTASNYSISIPSFMKKTNDLNDDASLQYENMIKEVYVVIIDEFQNEIHNEIEEYGLLPDYEKNFQGYTKLKLDQFDESYQISNKLIVKDTINLLPAVIYEVTVSVENTNVYMNYALVKGKTKYYQIMTWTLADRKYKYKNILKDIVYSFKENAVENKRNEQNRNLLFTFNNVDFEMVFVEGGSFVMGCSSEQIDCDDTERPAHSVTLSDYYIGKYEVTQKQWKAVMGSNIRQQRDLENPNYPLSGEGDDYPMYFISYAECKEFCKKLNSLLSNQLSKGYKFSLPTEAQWEYAARGGKNSKGYKYSGTDNVNEIVWYSSEYGAKMHKVGTKIKNELGIYDMSGNVWEWCLDWSGDYNSSPQINPKGQKAGVARILRGGNWAGTSRFCRVSHRGSDNPAFRLIGGGVRLALILQN